MDIRIHKKGHLLLHIYYILLVIVIVVRCVLKKGIRFGKGRDEGGIISIGVDPTVFVQ